jgi:hypothetical protein
MSAEIPPEGLGPAPRDSLTRRRAPAAGDVLQMLAGTFAPYLEYARRSPASQPGASAALHTSAEMLGDQP